MTKQEKLVLETIADNLRQAAKAGWTTGDIHKWSNWAETMKVACIANARLIETIVSTDEKDNENNKPLTLD